MATYDVSKLARLGDVKSALVRSKEVFSTKTELNTVSAKVDTLEAAGGEPNVITSVKVNGTALTITDKAVDVEIPVYSVVKDETSTDYAAVYHLTADGANTGVAINIPKDMVVSSGSVVVNPEGQTAGTYLKLVLANATNDEIYIPVDSLIEYVTSGSVTGDMIVVTVSDDHKVTATITDGTITKAKLASEIQTQLDKVDALSAGATKVEASTTNGYVKIDGTETKVYEHPTTTAKTATFVKVGNDANGHVVIGAAIAKSDITALGIPAQDTTYDAVTTSANGLMTSTDKTKLDGMEIATDDEVTAMLDEVLPTA